MLVLVVSNATQMLLVALTSARFRKDGRYRPLELSGWAGGNWASLRLQSERGEKMGLVRRKKERKNR